ncbi:MAG: hypothetical protein RJB34_2241 [Pseudomonadota bacterium]
MIVFSHGNSFPASTYSVLFRALRSRGFAVRAVEQFGHDPRYPVTSNWPHLVQQLANFAAPHIAEHGQAAWLVGHSLGGFLSLMCAARHPQLGGHGVAGVVLLDAPVLGGWRAQAVALAKHTQLVGSVSPGKVSRARRNSWPSTEAALAHFAHKKAFARWDPQVLRDYIEHGTHNADTPQGPMRVLSFNRDVETAIYNTLPHNLDRLLRRHPLQCPVGFVGGTESEEIRQVGLNMTRRVVGPRPERLRMVAGSHLFPMEEPLLTAQLVAEVIKDLRT